MIPKQYQKYEKVVSIGCVNFTTVWGNKQANLDKMKKYISDAAEQGNNFVVFPELALSGYECDEGCMHRTNAETVPGPSTEEIAALAKKHNVYVVFGLPEKDKKDPNIHYISSAVVGPEGILGTYRKLHLMEAPFTETKCFKPGNDLPIFETKYGPVGIQICYDFWSFPEITRILALKGARIIINTTASPSGPGKPYFMVQQTGARATENIVYAASANLTGKDRTKTFYGHSTIAGRGSKLAQIYAEGGEEEGIISATLSFELLHKLRETSPVLEKVRYDVILKELKILYND
jgi:predicted amidohydrolase